MRHSKTGQHPNVQIELAQDVPADAADYARDKMLHLVKYTHRPILSIKVRLTPVGHGKHQDVVAHANLDIDGTPVISHSVGRTATEAVDLLQDKLRGQLGRI